MNRTLLFTLLTAALCHAAPAENSNPIEVGKVKWGRDLPEALAASKKSGKPVSLLFQEVSGCASYKNFGRDVLSDPEIVKSIESSFVPVLIHNNKGGKDAEVLKQFGEPAWNYQVVRFLDSAGKDLIPRKKGVRTVAEFTQRIPAALAEALPKP
jgi:hypothetical protein